LVVETYGGATVETYGGATETTLLVETAKST
jgi:hypothetical protein